MIVNKGLIAAATLLSAALLAPTLAHDDYGDHAEHGRFNHDLDEAHHRPHQEGFYSSTEHRAYQRALPYLHEDYDDHLGNAHDHYEWHPWWLAARWVVIPPRVLTG